MGDCMTSSMAGTNTAIEPTFDRKVRPCSTTLRGSYVMPLLHPLKTPNMGRANQLTGEHVRGALYIQTVNSRHERFKDLLRRHCGIATKYLDSYVKCFHRASVHADPSPHACFNAVLEYHA